MGNAMPRDKIMDFILFPAQLVVYLTHSMV